MSFENETLRVTFNFVPSNLLNLHCILYKMHSLKRWSLKTGSQAHSKRLRKLLELCRTVATLFSSREWSHTFHQLFNHSKTTLKGDTHLNILYF